MKARGTIDEKEEGDNLIYVTTKEESRVLRPTKSVESLSSKNMIEVIVEMVPEGESLPSAKKQAETPQPDLTKSAPKGSASSISSPKRKTRQQRLTQ